MRPLVSAIIATYTRSDLLHEALDSVYVQEGQGDVFDLEVVVVDDASPSDAHSIVARYPARYIRHQVNRGPAAARNTGIEASRGEYVAFLDDDDLWLPEKLRIQVPVLESNPDVGLVYSPQSFRPRAWTGPSGRVFEELLTDNFLGPIRVLVRRAALARVGNFDERLSGVEDYDLWLRLAYYFPFKFVPGPTGVHRGSPHGLFMTQVASGVSRQLHRRVIDKALTLALHFSGEVAEKIRNQVELTNFSHLTLLPARTAIPQMLAHLQERPGIARHANVRTQLARMVRLDAAASSSPLQCAGGVCETLKRVAGDARQARRLVAAVWIETALGLLSSGRGPQAAYAAREAFRHDPMVVARRWFAWARRAKRGLVASSARLRRVSI